MVCGIYGLQRGLVQFRWDDCIDMGGVCRQERFSAIVVPYSANKRMKKPVI